MPHRYIAHGAISSRIEYDPMVHYPLNTYHMRRLIPDLPSLGEARLVNHNRLARW